LAYILGKGSFKRDIAGLRQAGADGLCKGRRVRALMDSHRG